MQRAGLRQHRAAHCYKARYVSGRLSRSLPARLQRYYKQRYTLFSKYDCGVEIDEEMWYSVTPEPIAKEQARKVAAAQRGMPSIVVDSFCGAGGNSIQLARSVAQQGGLVLCADLHPQRLHSVWSNSCIYGVERHIELLLADACSLHQLLRPGVVSGVFLAPPWSDEGLLPRGEAAFTVRRLGAGLDAAKLLEDSLKLGQGAALFLPRVTPNCEVQALAVRAQSDVFVQEHIKVDKLGQTACKPTAITCYFGSWAAEIPAKVPKGKRLRLTDDERALRPKAFEAVLCAF